MHMPLLTVMMTKTRKPLTHWFAVMRYSVIAKEVFPVVVAMIPKHATMIGRLLGLVGRDWRLAPQISPIAER